jgi:hypothetical protein
MLHRFVVSGPDTTSPDAPSHRAGGEKIHEPLPLRLTWSRDAQRRQSQRSALPVRPHCACRVRWAYDRPYSGGWRGVYADVE